MPRLIHRQFRNLFRSHLCLLVTFGLFHFEGAAVNAEFMPRLFTAWKTSTPPTVDGDLTDPAWSQSELISDFFAFESGGDPPAAETTARVLWDDDFLYLAMEMQDADIRSACSLAGACSRDSAIFNGDVIELFVKEQTTNNRYYEFEWSPLNDQFDARFDRVRFGSPSTTWDTAMTSAVQVNGTVDSAGDEDTSWSVEAAIPLTAFELTDVVPGTEWRFTFARYDYFNNPRRATPALMMSTRGDPDAPNGGVTSGFHTYEIYDRLQFAAIPEPSTAVLLGCSVLVAFGRATGRIR